MPRRFWSYATGKKGISRVRVYERSVAPGLYIEWHWQGRRYQKALGKHVGYPVTDKRIAMKIAHETSRHMEQRQNQHAHMVVFGSASSHTLSELLDHRSGDERFRRFWLSHFGADCVLTDITPAAVEAATSEMGWSPKTEGDYRRYIVSAYSFAETKLRWIRADHNLSAVDLPKPTGISKAYTLAEVRLLLPALEEVDIRAGWIGHVAWQSGRRLQAIRTLMKDSVQTGPDHSVLAFPAGTDKAKRSGQVVVVGRAHELTVELMRTPGSYVCGLTPPRKELCLKGWMPRAEKLAGIAHEAGRGFHGIKRRYATEARHIEGFDKQAGTTKTTLERRYVQDDKLDEKRSVASALSGLLCHDPLQKSHEA